MTAKKEEKESKKGQEPKASAKEKKPVKKKTSTPKKPAEESKVKKEAKVKEKPEEKTENKQDKKVEAPAKKEGEQTKPKEQSKPETSKKEGDRRPKDRAAIQEEERRQAIARALELWQPKTGLGAKVKNKQITNIHDALNQSSPIKEVEIVDCLLPELDEEILSVDNVQRTTDSGRRMRFRVMVAVGNRNGYVGLGVAKGKEIGPTIRRAIEKAKLGVIEVKRGCGSWECGCGQAHTAPYKVDGKAGSVRVTLNPAPRGIGLVSGEIAQKILSLAGITDIWLSTKGHTRTGVNFSQAIFGALQKINNLKLRQVDNQNLNVKTGIV